ncbi:hypothetical protein TSUD_343110 [Trifolium subterraneum]|nr:hypothetical protein TSUD_343110 [Trifolium subterraneum]
MKVEGDWNKLWSLPISPKLEARKEAPDKELARAQGVMGACVRNITWSPPQADYVKCNIDAAIFAPENKTSMGACVRNDERQFITAMSAHINANMTPAVGEAWALQQKKL